MKLKDLKAGKYYYDNGNSEYFYVINVYPINIYLINSDYYLKYAWYRKDSDTWEDMDANFWDNAHFEWESVRFPSTFSPYKPKEPGCPTCNQPMQDLVLFTSITKWCPECEDPKRTKPPPLLCLKITEEDVKQAMVDMANTMNSIVVS